ncbi:hybrid sensor histidine kinase/response regulator [Desulforhopalus vacuolatus]|uniref:hybrid sensor histidine kinase/response regulator n=1 Tax=Desulforhopalus vacuolatus TaxID=40414 RepID=UPI001F055768|nr:ABC transporter substrate binding protein [Desulforhopalus vacuolatus]
MAKRGLTQFFLFTVFFLILFSNLHIALAETSQKNVPHEVLIVHSDYQGYPWTDSLNAGITDVFNSSPLMINLQFEYLDSKRNKDKYYFEQLRQLWNIKYNKRHVDLIIVCSNLAYDFVMLERNNLFNGIPIVFTSYIGFTAGMLDGKQPVTGVVQETDIISTIDTALLLHPQTRKIVFVAPGAPPFRMVWLEGLEERYAKRVEIRTVIADTTAQIDAEINSLGRDIVVIPLNSVLKNDGTYIPFVQFVSHLSIERPFPVYALWDISLGAGVVGGKMVSGISQGRGAAKLALQILQGTPLSDVPVVTNSPNQYMFDWEAMQQFKIHERDLPQNSIVINHPISFYTENKTIVHVTVIIILSLILLILSLFIVIVRLRKAQKDLLISDKTLKESEARFKKIIKKSPLPMLITDQNQDLSFLNDKFTELFGYTIEDISTAEEWWCTAYPDLEYRKKVQNSWLVAIEKASASATDIEIQEWDLTIKNGSTRRCEFFMFPLEEMSVIIMNDISKRISDEAEKNDLGLRLQQAQKMEAIGTLAGGIAHDFNNILSVILGFTQLAKDNSEPDSTVSKYLDEVLGAGLRAKGLVQQILAFSRQKDVERIFLQPAVIVKETIKMLRSSLPSTININQNIDSQTGWILADPTQINQILMNLCTNAFHAMEKTGGNLDISLKEVNLSSEYLIHEPGIADGTFIQLSIADSGVGIPPTVKAKIFDPYFTTKEAGKGTGMGLAMVHGIVKSYGGVISLYSELGDGTVFNVFLPVVEKELLSQKEKIDQIPSGKERILFVDDEESLGKMSKTMLERIGYHVTVRKSSFEALETFQKQPDQFDLVITDQTMPAMTGSEMSRRMLQIRPDIPIILCTGYSSTISEEKAKSMGIKDFALKPLEKKDIATLIRKVLDA